VRSRWDRAEAAGHAGELGARVYSSRLLGSDPALVLHGGGNTSVKTREPDVFGREQDILRVKGSGWDLATIEADGFVPCRLEHLLALAELESLPDLEMARQLRLSLTAPLAPDPSVEAILHAVLPHRYVDHTHADAVLALGHSPGGFERTRELYGELAVAVPYVMPGFQLARHCAELVAAAALDGAIGMILHLHGVFTWGETAEESYERMLRLVTLAEDVLPGLPAAKAAEDEPVAAELAGLRARISAAAGRPLIVTRDCSPRCLEFARRDDVGVLSHQGPVTPDDAIRTKRVPLVGRDVEAYARDYKRYFAEHSDGSPTMLDPAPRIVLDPELGLCAAGPTAAAADAAGDLYRRTVDVILRAAAFGGYEALPPQDVFDVEYWDLEQAKLRRGGTRAVLEGEVALVTGAASGIGRGCADAFLARGAAVVGLDLDPAIEEASGGPFLGIHADVAEEAEIDRALELAVRRFGGLDMLVLNAGVFPASRAIAELDLDEWSRVFRVNLDAAALALRAAAPFLRLAPRGGRVVVVGSKNVPAPGPGAAAYSASKAALTQLARVAALEWGADGIRVNVVHPNQVFDTGIWTEEVLATRAASYGLTVDEYRRSNVLGTEIRSRDVGELVAELCGPVFARTTGAQIPIDGGNERVI
jgi:rhamnose utilization protein RhaD (predicted bifunctional aldolase and dehydrogenase)/NAD(P)-dependent dehydrogenase (short-subunit alcohol dehydrogenase family)